MQPLKTNKEFKFNGENEVKFQNLTTRYPTKKALILPSLWLIQEQEGFISEEAMQYIAERLELSPMEVYSIASFYVMFNFAPKGKYHIKVCKTLSCELRGNEELIECLENELNLKMGESNQNFSLSEVECLGHCEVAPTIQINDEFYKDMDIEKLKELLVKLKV